MRTFSRQPVDPMTGRPLGPVTTYVEPDAEIPEDPAPSVDVEDPSPYPEGGNIASVLAWVDDPDVPDAVRSDRAKAAIVAEHGRGKPRPTLLAELDERTGR